MERTELFPRSIGEDTDIVEKEMYTFPDRKGDLITLRPEATASVVRSYIQHKLYANDPVQKFYTSGPCFAGNVRKREISTILSDQCRSFWCCLTIDGCPAYFYAGTLFDRLASDIKAHMNPWVSESTRILRSLAGYADVRRDQLCSDCNRRRDRNPLRVLDCKVPTCREALTDAPSIQDRFAGSAGRFYLPRSLGKTQGSICIDKRLVRGLDYYTRTTFEMQTGALGAQSAVAGGGRYDGLVKTLAVHQPAIGFAVGFDRLGRYRSECWTT